MTTLSFLRANSINLCIASIIDISLYQMRVNDSNLYKLEIQRIL